MSDGNEHLEGILEMDETYIGGKPRKYQSAKFGKNIEMQSLTIELKNLKAGLFLRMKHTRKMQIVKTQNVAGVH